MEPENPFIGVFQVKRLAASVASDFELPVEKVLGPCRRSDCTRARAVIVQFCRERGMTYQAIGARLGGRDHSSVVHSYRNFQIYHDYYRTTRESYERHLRMQARAEFAKVNGGVA